MIVETTFRECATNERHRYDIAAEWFCEQPRGWYWRLAKVGVIASDFDWTGPNPTQELALAAGAEEIAYINRALAPYCA